ncbi:hypothetical protein CSB09_01955 [Candidatus Gracilibacteria bacterium]|nr:MAG: hypothetical protein CSB09_01955 [Candidatus Gracilibacteria bacterium]
MEFVNAKVEDFAKEFLESGKTADALVIDPPRSGMHPKAIPTLLQFAVGEIVYVSCNPATLARDLEDFLKAGYQIKNVVPVDMFPHTHHIETVVHLIKA